MLDEVDILFSDEVFEVALQSLINSSPVTTQYLFVTATLPVDVYNKLIEVFPDCEVIMGPGMHCTSAGLEEVGFELLSLFTVPHPFSDGSRQKLLDGWNLGVSKCYAVQKSFSQALIIANKFEGILEYDKS